MVNFKDGQIWADMEFRWLVNTTFVMPRPQRRWRAPTEFPKTKSASALKTFKSVKRRLEVARAGHRNHHHRRFRTSSYGDRGKRSWLLRARYPGSRLWAMLEPRSNTMRRKVLQDDLERTVLAWQDEVIIVRMFLNRRRFRKSSNRPRHEWIAKVQKRGPACSAFWPTQIPSWILLAPEIEVQVTSWSILSNGWIWWYLTKNFPKRLKEIESGCQRITGAIVQRLMRMISASARAWILGICLRQHSESD